MKEEKDEIERGFKDDDEGKVSQWESNYLPKPIEREKKKSRKRKWSCSAPKREQERKERGRRCFDTRVEDT